MSLSFFSDKYDFVVFPITKAGSLYVNSITEIHMLQFIKCLNRSKELQKWLRRNILKIFQMSKNVKIHIYPFFCEGINVSTLLPHLNQIIFDYLVTYYSKETKTKQILMRQIRKNSNLISNNTLIQVGAGDTDSINAVNLLATAFVLYANIKDNNNIDDEFYLNSPLKKKRRIGDLKSPSPPVLLPESPNKLTDDFENIHDDYRRTIFGIKVPSKEISCIFKMTSTKIYFEPYIWEKKNYTFFKKAKEEQVIHFYGGGFSYKSKKKGKRMFKISSTQGKTIRLHLNVDFIPNISVKEKSYYIATEWDPNFITLQDAYQENRSSTNMYKHYANILSTIGYLNSKYGFFHGDLKTDNVLVSRDANYVKCFDFDFSGVCGKIKNHRVLSYNFSDRERVLITKFIDTNRIDGKSFLFVLDIYRLFVSIVLNCKRYDTLTKLNKMTATNGVISFSMKNIVHFFNSLIKDKKCTERKITCVQEYIADTYDILDTYNWNKTIMHGDILINIYIAFSGDDKIIDNKKRKR
tara:strand:+ start:50 stop:1615 length:1566 start_codon:yes stop_codon:yes gene_type:complete